MDSVHFLVNGEEIGLISRQRTSVATTHFTVLLPLAASVLVGLLLLPTVALLAHQPWTHLIGVWRQLGMGPLGISLMTTLIAMVIMTLAGTPLGWWIARGGRGWRVLEYSLLFPLLMPPLVVGLVLAYLLGPYGLFGPWFHALGISGTNSELAVVVAEIYESMPYYILAVIASVRQVPRALEQVAWVLGCPPWKAAWRVLLPLAWPGLVAGLAMAFARAVGAFGAVIVVAYFPHTLPVAIWVGLQEQGIRAAFPLALLLLLVALPAPLILFVWRRMPHADL